VSSLVEIQNLTVRYPLKGGGTHVVFSNLNLRIHSGEFVCIVGETGCGKSTLLRLLLGSERPAEGSVVVDGVAVAQPNRDRGYVPQKYSLFPDKTVIQNIAFGPVAESLGPLCLFLPAWWRHRKRTYAEAHDYLRRVGLSDRDAGKYPDQISGGMQQRVAIAQSLMLRPKILLMDESFSALDPGTRRSMQRMLRSIWAENKTTIVFVTHNLAEAVYLGNRVLHIAKNDTLHHSEIVRDIAVPDYSRDADGDPKQAEADRIIREIDPSAGTKMATEEIAELAT
jgi:NitT/TauT family transport system ATP-binding protein